MTLPNDVLYIILGLLRDERDYSTLYQCALSSKFLAEHALMLLYQIHDTAPVTGGDATVDETIKARQRGSSVAIARRHQMKTIQKWSTMWRSLVLSTFDRTYLPYYAYIRYLNFSDLSELLSLPSYGGSANVHFFTPELRDFIEEKPLQARAHPTTKVFPNSGLYTRTIGSLIIGKTTSIRGLHSNRRFALVYTEAKEVMTCSSVQESSDQLISEYIPEMPLLESLSVWRGEALTHAGEKIHKHCPEFKRLTVYRWGRTEGIDDSYDPGAEKFLNALRPHTLEHFEVPCSSPLGVRSIRGIGSHINSLEVLKLSGLDGVTIRALSSLPTPPRLKTLTLTDSRSLMQDDTFGPMVERLGEWIHGCRSLRQLELRKFVDDTFLLSHVLSEGGPRLTTLGLANFSVDGADSFHEALATQESLQKLRLSGECLDEPEDIEGMVQALAQLKDLQVLELLEVSDDFTQDHIITLMPFLPRLEQLAIGGDHFDNSIWNAFLCLSKLKSLSINALSEFTAQGILDFIVQLGPGNRGFNLSILNSTNAANLTDEEQSLIRDTLENSLGGAFDFGLAQEEYSDIDSDGLSD